MLNLFKRELFKSKIRIMEKCISYVLRKHMSKNKDRRGGGSAGGLAPGADGAAHAAADGGLKLRTVSLKPLEKQWSQLVKEI